MKTNSWKLSALVCGLILVGLNACTDQSNDTPTDSLSEISVTVNDSKRNDGKSNNGKSNNDKSDDNDPVVLPTTYTPDAGRLLGSHCAQCHGTNGVSINEWDSIAGEDELESEILEDDEPIMTAQAHGYTDEEIILIGEWLKTLTSKD